MADYFQVEFREDGREHKIYLSGKLEGLCSKIELVREDKVKFELTLTPEIAIMVFDLLKQ